MRLRDVTAGLKARALREQGYSKMPWYSGPAHYEQPRPDLRVGDDFRRVGIWDGSPERDNAAEWHGLMAKVRRGEPFWCHQGMHEAAGGRYVPLETDERGQPVGHPLCSGWLAARAAHARKA